MLSQAQHFLPALSPAVVAVWKGDLLTFPSHALLRNNTQQIRKLVQDRKILAEHSCCLGDGVVDSCGDEYGEENN